MWLFVITFAFSWNKYCLVSLFHPKYYDIKFVDDVLIFIVNKLLTIGQEYLCPQLEINYYVMLCIKCVLCYVL